MNKGLQDKLFEKYDVMFCERHLDMSKTCMCWGIECRDGWYHILDQMCNNIARLEATYDISIIFKQVKEKFGTLRIYHTITFGDRWTKKGLKWLFDKKEKIDFVSMGWTNSKKVPAYACVENQVDECIRMAEHFSEITCEDCGITGATRNTDGWIVTLCDTCRNKRMDA